MARFFDSLDMVLAATETSMLLTIAFVTTPLGLLFWTAGNNMMDRGRGGKTSDQGASYIGLGALMLAVGPAIGVYLATRLPSEYCLMIGLGLMISSKLGLNQVEKQGSKKRRMAKAVRELQAQRDYESWQQFVQDVTPEGFEKFCAWIFFKSGFAVRHTGRSGDLGIDIELKKNSLFQVAQCKRFTDRAVTSAELRDFYGAMMNARADHGHVMTTSRYTKDAIKWARGKAITLWDRPELEPWVARWAGRSEAVQEPVRVCGFCDSENRAEARFCSKCGGPLR